MASALSDKKPPETAAPAGASVDPDFAKVIEKSREKIRTAQSDRAEKRLRRGRGRPRKDGRPPMQSRATEIRGSVGHASDAMPEGPAVAATPAPSMAPLLKNPLIFVSKIPAQKYQIPELALADDEAMACAQSLDMVVQAFVPNIGEMSPQTAAVISAASVIGSIGFQKYSIFRTKMSERQIKTEAAVATPQPETAPAPGGAAFPTTPATDYFQR